MQIKNKFRGVDAQCIVIILWHMEKTIPTYKFAVRDDLLNESISFLPEKGTELSSGWDVKAAPLNHMDIIINPYEYIKISLGFRTICPDGWWLELRPRSSSFTKKSLHFLYGVIDEDYEGDMIFAAQYIPQYLYRDSNHSYNGIFAPFQEANILKIKFGESIGQLIPVKRQDMIVSNISNDEFNKLSSIRKSNRGSGGFGSTDEKK
jgi:dUTPase